MADTSLWFKINEDKGGEVLHFKRRDGKLWKLGDGTFGVVYVVHSELRDNDFAIKLLYDNDSTAPRPLSRLPEEAVRAITERVLEEEGVPEDRRPTVLDVVLHAYRQADTLGLALSRAGVSEWEGLLERVRRRANSTAVERFHRESRVSGIIRADQLARQRSAQTGGTVDIIGSTQRFKSYPAYEMLKHEFSAMGVSVSDYALVMDKYEFSMKDLLEIGPGESWCFKPAVLDEVFASRHEAVPDAFRAIARTREDLIHLVAESALSEDDKARLQDCIGAPAAGYEILKRMSFEERIRTALPFLRDIVVGLKRLHTVSYTHGGPLFHLDIKPANIYVRRDDQKGLVCALGDLGFLPPEPGLDRTMDTSVDDLPLGTLHYRSPEQKEHFDVANVEIRASDGALFLDVRDPKFSGSFVETGDSVLFSRDKARTRHIIQDILPATATSPTRVRVAACADESREGEQTQVVFLKRQEYRTDLFGVGAIAFDLISCGRSSERFYESIRRFEFDGTEPGSVESTIAKYRRVKDGLADEPELVHIFEPLRHGSEYAPETYVELILRCMLYNADETFYAPYGMLRPTPEQISRARDFEDPRSKAIADVLAFIDNQLDYRNNSLDRDNPLITQRLPESRLNKGDRLETVVNRLQRADYDWKLRLAESSYFFEKLAALVQDRTKAADHPFLYQMLPSGIRVIRENVQSPFQFAYSAYSSERDYLNDLRWADMDKMLKTVTHPFVPYQVAFARREVMLTRDGSAPATGQDERCSLRFLDATALTSQVRPGDWVVTRAGDDERHLWEIVDVSGPNERRRVVLRPGPDHGAGLFEGLDDPQREAVYYSRLIPAKYYLDVLGLYLLNLFVANSPLTINGREKIHVEEPAERVARNPTGFIYNMLRPQNGKSVVRDIYGMVAGMYHRLTCHESTGSYYGQGARGGAEPKSSDILLAVVNDAKALRNKVEEFLAVPRNTFENELPCVDRLTHVGPEAQRQFDVLVKDPLDIKAMMFEMEV